MGLNSFVREFTDRSLEDLLEFRRVVLRDGP